MAKKKQGGSKNKSAAASRPKKVRANSDKLSGNGEETRVVAEETNGEESNDFPIVGIGASAGGLQALKDFLDSFPDSPGVALVIVQHLDPTRKSLAPELLAAHTSMKLCEVVDNPRVRPNSVYVIPPGKYLSIAGGELRLSEPDQPRGARMAIDYFLRSLAKDINQRSVGVIMSGGGTDGTLGIKLVKEVGGMVMVQDPQTADHDSMPRSAIDTGVVDFILPPAKMADVLVRYAGHSYVRQPSPSLLVEDHVDAAIEPPASEIFNSILALLRVRSKHDFRNYKVQTLFRRTRRRMCLAHLDDYAQYLEYLREHPEEIDALVKDLLISVTNFFRDPEAWEELRKYAIVPIVEQSNSDEAIRFWVPGCATGEEPYSLAMLLLEELGNARRVAPIQIFATDIDKDALDYARHGVYPASIQVDVSPERLKRYFVKIDGDDHYRVSKQVRELVVFAEQNLIADPPFSKLNLVCCRNLMIYLKPDIQDKVISLFHFSLHEDGYLFLGTAETIGRQTDLFSPLSKRWRIFQRIGPTRPDRVEIPLVTGAPRREVGDPTPKMRQDMQESRLTHLANQGMVDWLSPAAVLVDEKWRILYVKGDVDKYIQHAQGVPKEDLLEKVRRGLRIKIRAAVQRALEADREVSTTAQVQFSNEYIPVRISVRPIRDAKEGRTLALVVFEDESSSSGDGDTKGTKMGPSRRLRKAGGNSASAPSAGADADLDEHKVIQQLEQELGAAREDLQASLEQFDASSEDFKAANEEVMSVNEELQSTNEELETSKEELQSLNEELSTVNNQLAAKVEELETQHADLKNLISATDVPTLCLDREMCIRWFTPAATRVIRLNETDTGRPLSDIAHDFAIDDLADKAGRVLRTLTPVTDEVASHDGRSFMRRIVPYRTEDHRIVGVVTTLVDISQLKESESALVESERRYRELAKMLEQKVEHRIRAVKVLHDITMASNAAKTFEAAIKAALERICHHNGWVLGNAWRLSDEDDALVSTKIWQYLRGSEPVETRFDGFRAASEQIRLPLDDEFVGRVVRTGEPQFVENVDAFAAWKRENPSQYGLRSAVAFPVFSKTDVVAVLEFFSDHKIERDDAFLDIMPQVGIQLGHVFERKRLEREVAIVADSEQLRMGQEMHDGLSQQIAGIAMLAGSLAESLQAEGAQQAEKAAKVARAIEDAKQQARALSKGLMPIEIDSHGLRVGLEELAERTQKTYDIECAFECPERLPIPDNFTATHLYRIAREAVHNAVKHAKASRILIRLTDGKTLTLGVSDNGRGFDGGKATEGEGLRIMRHRAGLIGADFLIRADESGGTTVTCRIEL